MNIFIFIGENKKLSTSIQKKLQERGFAFEDHNIDTKVTGILVKNDNFKALVWDYHTMFTGGEKIDYICDAKKMGDWEWEKIGIKEPAIKMTAAELKEKMEKHLGKKIELI